MLKFEEYQIENKSDFDLGGVQIIYKFPNGFGASCLNSKILHFYPFAWEIAVLDKNGELTYDTPVTSDVVIVDDDDEANEVLKQIMNLEEK